VFVGVKVATFQAAIALTSSNLEVVTCSGTTATTLTGCSGGTGTLATNDAVSLTSQGTAATITSLTPSPNVTTSQTLATVVSFAASNHPRPSALGSGRHRFLPPGQATPICPRQPLALTCWGA
jgi:hypothetical protein